MTGGGLEVTDRFMITLLLVKMLEFGCMLENCISLLQILYGNLYG